MTPALDAVSAGDLAWWTGDRPEAVACWRAALTLADDAPEGLAAQAMAHVRLMRREGNLAPLWHETKMSRALSACPVAEPWCRIAEADALLFLPSFAGGDPTRVDEVLQDNPLVGPASARRVLAGAPLTTLTGTLDGMGEGIRAAGRHPPDPGTWTLGVGVGGAVGVGVGLVVRFVHPDLGGAAHRLDTMGAVSSRGAGFVSAALTTDGEVPVQVGGVVARTVGDLYGEGSVSTSTWWTERVSVGIAPSRAGTTLQVGGAARWDDTLFNTGPYATLTFGGDSRVQVSADAGTGDYDHLDVRASLRGRWHAGRTSLSAHLLGEVVPTPSTPWTRLPYAGGEDLLRGLPAGRYRDDHLLAAQAEVAHPLVGPLKAAAFFDLAAVEGVHWTAGGGLRLVLPPERDNVTRVDVGVGPEGWGLVVAWGEAF